jgi:fatty acid desaturase
MLYDLHTFKQRKDKNQMNISSLWYIWCSVVMMAVFIASLELGGGWWIFPLSFLMFFLEGYPAKYWGER